MEHVVKRNPDGRGRFMWLMALAMAAMAGGIACDADDVLRAIGIDTVARLDLMPQSTTLFVGQRTSFTARLNGSLLIPGESTTWRSSDPAVATVDSAGNVTCVGPGTASISAVIDRPGPDDSGDTASVTCVEPQLVELSTARVEYRHSKSQNLCPDAAGGFSITNRSSGTVTLALTSSHPALSPSAAGARLAPGETLMVDLRFDCSTLGSFVSQLTIAATADSGSVQTAVLPVAVTIEP